MNGPYHAIMTALTPADFQGGSPFATLFGTNENTDLATGIGGLDGLGPGGGGGTPAPQSSGLVAHAAALLSASAAAVGVEPLRRATASPFDNLVGVMKGGPAVGGMGGMGGVDPYGANSGLVGGVRNNMMQSPGVVGSPYYYTPTGQSRYGKSQ